MSASHCPVCSGPLTGRTCTCGACGTPHHEECWTYAGGCAVYACRPQARAATKKAWPKPLPTFSRVSLRFAVVLSLLTVASYVLGVGVGGAARIAESDKAARDRERCAQAGHVATHRIGGEDSLPYASITTMAANIQTPTVIFTIDPPTTGPATIHYHVLP